MAAESRENMETASGQPVVDRSHGMTEELEKEHFNQEIKC